jgi:hypothetical protein
LIAEAATIEEDMCAKVFVSEEDSFSPVIIMMYTFFEKMLFASHVLSPQLINCYFCVALCCIYIASDVEVNVMVK